MGKMYLVDGDAPRAFRVSRYCRVIVFASIPLAAEKIWFRAPAYPSALRTAACLSPSARRMLDFFSPSATRMEASLLPSASVTVALLVLSADICRTIASLTSCGG